MQGMHRRILQRIRPRAYAGCGVLIIVLSAFTGCATHGKVNPVRDVQEPPPAQGRSSVKRLTDGREGFIITETPRMDAASRRDFERAIARMNDEEYAQAVDLLEKVIDKSPRVTVPHINMAIACQRLGKLEQAEAHIRTALDLVPEHPVAGNEYGLLCRKAGRFDEARTIYEKVVARFPDYYPVHRNLGILCDLYLNDLACALEHYEIYSRAMPEDKEVELWIADLRARLGHN
jgi:Tfp pilus assembly protein PilF